MTKQTDNITFDIKIPTGELVVTDWNRDWKQAFNQYETDMNINYPSGTKDQIERYSKVQIAHLFVGNSSPSVYLKNDTLTIGYGFDDESTTHYDPTQKEIGFICTDLWWATIMDKATLKENLAKSLSKSDVSESLDSTEYANQTIKPGIYRVEYNMDDIYDENVYATMTWIKPIH